MSSSSGWRSSFPLPSEPRRSLLRIPDASIRCWSGIRSSSTRSLRPIPRTPPVSGSGRSFTRRSSMRTTASSRATHQFSFTVRTPDGASRRAAVVAAAYTALVGLFPSRQAALDASYAASLAALSEHCEHGGQSGRRRRSCATRIERGIAWGTEVAQAVLAWRATDGFGASYPAFNGGTAVGQWRPTPPAFGADERTGVGIHGDVRPGQQHPVRSWTAARFEQRHLYGRFQRSQNARSQERVDAH